MPFEFLVGLRRPNIYATPSDTAKPSPSAAAKGSACRGRQEEAKLEARLERQEEEKLEAQHERKASRLRHHEQIDGVARIGWNSRKLRYVRLLSQPQEVWLHDKLRLGREEVGGYTLPVFASFIVPDDGTDIISRRWRLQARQYQIAVAAEFDNPKATGLTLATKQVVDDEGQIREVPGVGVILQSGYNFWKSFPCDHSGLVHVHREGRGRDTRFQFDRYANDPAVPLDHGVDVDVLIARLADPDRLHRLIDPLDADHHFFPSQNELLTTTGGGRASSPQPEA